MSGVALIGAQFIKRRSNVTFQTFKDNFILRRVSVNPRVRLWSYRIPARPEALFLVIFSPLPQQSYKNNKKSKTNVTAIKSHLHIPKNSTNCRTIETKFKSHSDRPKICRTNEISIESCPDTSKIIQKYWDENQQMSRQSCKMKDYGDMIFFLFFFQDNLYVFVELVEYAAK